MEIDKIIHIINLKQLNIKTNNCIITCIDDNSKKKFIRQHKKIIFNNKFKKCL